MGMRILNLKAKEEREMKILGKRKENYFIKTVPKQAMMKTIAGTRLRV